MSKNRARKQAACRLGIEFQKRYEKLALASGPDEITIAAVELGQLFNDNVEFVIWCLKTIGGLNPPGPEPVRRMRPILPVPANKVN